MVNWEAGEYSNHSARAGRFELGVCWDASRSAGSSDPPWVVTSCGFRLTKRFDELEDAKRAAEAFARKTLTAALKELGDE